MKELSICVHPDPVLRGRAQPVRHVGDEEKRLLEDMLANMRYWNGVGLAAPQVGVGLRVITAEAEGRAFGLANPVILERDGKDAMIEGCLSLPGTAVEVTRSRYVWIRALDTEDKKIELKLEGLLARIVQHEIDHLNGVLIIDHGPAILLEELDTEEPR